jgi:hypothetical protein
VEDALVLGCHAGFEGIDTLQEHLRSWGLRRFVRIFCSDFCVIFSLILRLAVVLGQVRSLGRRR